MKEIVNFFILTLALLKALGKFLDNKKFDFYSTVFLQIAVFLIIGVTLFSIDFILLYYFYYHTSFSFIILTIDFSIILFLTFMYIATFRLSLNSFILFLDNDNSIFERKSIISPFNKELLKVQDEEALVKKYTKKHRIYQYIYNYQVEQFDYIDINRQKYKEFVCQQKRFSWKRTFKYNSKMALLVVGFWGVFLITSIIAFMWSFLHFSPMPIIIIIHISIYIFNVYFLSKIFPNLYKENYKDKVKIMRYLRSFRH
ncbi:hypothetical protein [Staphylococcus ratti]|uniref:Uncharacterized protein n=1 Tax=Staphylococcus ratti TaxID=2892440 RepID=A0ABY3PD85_9STAP|nr:hypothetical protein [Staphylococcus ratti]UEX90199.1 hypothetical protein LN051_00535 [Staphylococcus ratti]